MAYKLIFQNDKLLYTRIGTTNRPILYYYAAINDFAFKQSFSLGYWNINELSFAKRYNKRWS